MHGRLQYSGPLPTCMVDHSIKTPSVQRFPIWEDCPFLAVGDALQYFIGHPPSTDITFSLALGVAVAAEEHCTMDIYVRIHGGSDSWDSNSDNYGTSPFAPLPYHYAEVGVGDFCT